MTTTSSNSIPLKALRHARRAFTLIEMLVVIAVIVVVLAIVAPSVARLMRSTNYASAVNAVTATLGRARAAAMESGRSTAVAFLFDIKTQKYTLQTLELAPSGATGAIDVDEQGDLTTSLCVQNFVAAYQPLQFSAAIELPPGMGVFGLSQMIPELDSDRSSPPLLDRCPTDNRIDPIAESLNGQLFDIQQWYAGEIINDGDNVLPDNNIVPWIFPRNDPRLYINEGDDPWLIIAQDPTQNGVLDEARAAVRHSMSFAVAFRPDGSVSSTFGAGLGPQPPLDAYIEFPDLPLDDLRDPPVVYDDALEFDPGTLHPTDQTETRPNPEVRLRTASQLAVVDLQSLRAGAGVNKPWLVRSETSRAPIPSNSSDPKLIYMNDELAQNMSQWIDENAQIIGFNRYTGKTVKR